MQPQLEQRSSVAGTFAPSVRISARAGAAFAVLFLLAIGLVAFDAVHNNSPDTHPLQSDRLLLRLAGLGAIVGCFAIVGTFLFRALRFSSRLRTGRCLHCGYDLRGQLSGMSNETTIGRCPECGHSFTRPDPAARPELTRAQRRALKLLAALDSWWFSLVNTIGFALAAALFRDRFIRWTMAAIALWDLCLLIRRLRRKRPTEFERVLSEAASTSPSSSTSPTTSHS